MLSRPQGQIIAKNTAIIELVWELFICNIGYITNFFEGCMKKLFKLSVQGQIIDVNAPRPDF